MTYINSIGIAVPPHRIAQDEHSLILESAGNISREDKVRLRRIYKSSGIDYRYSVLEEFGRQDDGNNILFHPANHQPELSVSKRMQLYESYGTGLITDAASAALIDSGYSPGDVTHIITFTCTGMHAPGPDIMLVEALGLRRSIERLCINFMGCYAAVNALKSAYHISRSDQKAVILVCGVELCTLHYQRSLNGEQLVANALFGDGAAACIVSSLPGKQVNLMLKSFYGEFTPEAMNDMVWSIGDNGFKLALSAQIPELILNSINPFFERLLSHAQITKNEVDFYAIHPGGMKVLKAVEMALSLNEKDNEIAYDILRNYGNMSSVTLLFILKEYMKKLTKDDKGKHLIACAFGPGITMESLLAEIH